MKKSVFTVLVFLLIISLMPVVVGCPSLPQVLFEASTNSGQAPLSVVFTNATDPGAAKNVNEFRWDFGDGSTKVTVAVTETATHTYTEAGRFTVTLAAVGTGDPPQESTYSLQITVEHGVISEISIKPDSATLDIGKTQQFEATAADAYGNAIPDARYTWNAAVDAGTITKDGTLTAGTKAGTFTGGVEVMATAGGETAMGKAGVTILPGPIETVSIVPFEVAADSSGQLEVIVEDEYGNPVEDADTTWTLTEDTAGTLSPAGRFAAGKKAGVYAGAVAVTVTQGRKKLEAVSDAVIIAGPITQVGIAPEKINIGIGQTQQFVAVAADRYGNRVEDADFNWSVAGDAGSITSDGLFTANDLTDMIKGVYSETVTATTGEDDKEIKATAKVNIEPDRIIFFSNRFDTEEEFLQPYMMNTDGSDVTPIFEDVPIDYGITVSPDGRRLIHVGSEDGETLNMYVSNLDGSWQTVLLVDQLALEPDWSPDGLKIAFQSWEHDPAEIYAMDVDGGNLTQLTDNDYYDDYPDWSPDGTQIAYISDRDPASAYPDVYVMNADGSDKKQITRGHNYDVYPDWSPDGTEIMFQSNRLATAHWGIFVMDTDGANIHALNPDSDWDSSNPCWSPDGSKIVYDSDMDDEEPEIYVMDRDGGNITRLTSDPAIDAMPVWLPPKRGVKVDESSVRIADLSGVYEEMGTNQVTSMTSGAVVRIVTDVASGSGFIIDSDGLIVTANHVIRDAEEIAVYTDDGTEYDATVRSNDQVHDMAILEIDASDLPYLEFGSLGDIELGQQILVLGFPLGRENISVTSGLVSAIEFDDGINTTWIQTDSAVNPGNSGGPMLDLTGRVIGMVARKIFSVAVEGVGFAISVETIELYLPALLDGITIND